MNKHEQQQRFLALIERVRTAERITGLYGQWLERADKLLGRAQVNVIDDLPPDQRELLMTELREIQKAAGGVDALQRITTENYVLELDKEVSEILGRSREIPS